MAAGVEGGVSREDLEAVVAWLDAHATSWAVQASPPAGDAEIDSLLDAASLTATGRGWAKFVRPHGKSVPDTFSSTLAASVVDHNAAAVFGETVATGFGLPSQCASWFAALVERPSWRCVLATLDGEAVGGGAIFVQDGAAWFGIEATLAGYRDRGVQQRIIAEQMRVADAMGARVQTCETAQPLAADEPGFSSFRNQKRAGFVHRYTRPNYKRAS